MCRSVALIGATFSTGRPFVLGNYLSPGLFRRLLDRSLEPLSPGVDFAGVSSTDVGLDHE